MKDLAYLTALSLAYFAVACTCDGRKTTALILVISSMAIVLGLAVGRNGNE